jgi:uncharacterized protein (DUF1697 family)
MIRYIAFLRAINVGGSKLIKMTELNQMFLSMGFHDVKTYIQSGNVIFLSEEQELTGSNKKIENLLRSKLGYDVTVILRTFHDVETIVNLNPFEKAPVRRNTKLYISFLTKAPAPLPILPITSIKDGLEIFQIINREAFILSHEINGRFGFPNNFIEKVLNTTATTRNWTTISQMIASYS